MRRRGPRVALVLLFAGAVGAAGADVVVAERRAAAERLAARAFEDLAGHAAAALAAVRGAQQAYVAAGQGEEFWMARVASGVETLTQQLAALAEATTTPDAAAAVSAAQDVLRNFEQMDRRAREFTRGGQRLLASDLIFADGREMIFAAAGHVETARRSERDARDQLLADLRARQVYLLGGSAAAALLVIGLLLPVRRPGEQSPQAAAESAAAPAGAVPLVAETPDRGPDPPPPPAPDLMAAAVLCTDLACLADTAGLPVLLDRAAQLLGAAGLIIWVMDQEGRELRPSLAHGYSPQALARIGPIPRDADNATAAAFRAACVQVVDSSDQSNGAIVAPLVTPLGCSGALAAEVRDGSERNPTTRALACIVAAQLATLIAAPVVPEAAKAESV